MAQATRGSSGRGRKPRTGNSNTTKKRVTPKQVQRNVEPMSDELINEITLLIIGAIALFLFLCNILKLGFLGTFISDLTFGIFGFFNYIMPILIAFLVVFGLVNMGDSIAGRKIAASIVLYLMLAMSCELISNTPIKDEPLDLKAIYSFAATNHKGGGFFGGILAFLGVKYLDIIGSVLLILVISIICIIIITNRSFVNTIKDGSQRAYEKGQNSARRARSRAMSVKEGNLKRKEQRLAKERERRLKLEEEENNRILTEVSGVKTYNFVQEDELIDNVEKIRDDIHEINLTNMDEEYDNRTIDYGNSDYPHENINEVNFEEYANDDNDSDSDYDFDNDYELSADEYSEDDYIDPFADDDAPKPIAKVKNDNYSQAMSSSIFASGSHEVTNGGRTFSSNTTTNPESIKATPKPKKVLNRPYKIPPLNLLKKGNTLKAGNDLELRATATKLEEVLKSFGVKVKVSDMSQGPSVTRYEMIPETGVKVSKILSLSDDIKLNLAAADIRIEAPIPGKAAIGIEVPNKESSAVLLRDLLESKEFKESKSTISFAVGKDLAGKVVVADIGKMPHMLIAGATGSGKSVCINTLIMSILYKANPDEVKLIMIDPKVVELSVYNNIPHLLIPVVTDPKKASASLAWAVSEMNDRYQKFADYGVRDIKGYNEKIKDELDENGNPMKQMYKLVVIVDELADMMMVAGKEVEESICRLAQLARAAGIHLILATQRPSVDVITGLIKANMPSRVSFAVSSGVDSRTILDMNGAEKLLGKGDMLFYPQGYTKPARVQGAFVSDEEVAEVVKYLKNQQIGNNDEEDISSKINSLASSQGGSSNNNGSASSGSDSDMDEYFIEAGRIIVESGKCSIGMLQRKFKIGFNRAARIMDSLSDYNVVGPDEGTKPRTILMSPEEFEEFVNSL